MDNTTIETEHIHLPVMTLACSSAQDSSLGLGLVQRVLISKDAFQGIFYIQIHDYD